MLSQTMLDALNDHITHELASGYLYLSMSSFFESVNLPGFAHWMRLQHQEEMNHGLKILDHVHDRGGRVVLGGIDKPASEFGSALAAIEKTVSHEKQITSRVHALCALAQKEGDFATFEMLQWFVKEQVEEERNANQLLEQLKMAGDKPSTLLMIDHQVGKRGG